ncbi:MAG TPA: TorF family putative porin, partial [Steroidobacteraceae bacterium]|nr:TorF family putative porin [Steroidobacteraceae bacterium]
MIKSRVYLAGALLAAAGAANAGVSVTPTVVSDYDFRGISQTAEDPAFQLGLNYAHESGFYAGLWGSNVDFGLTDPDIEVDAFAGFTGGDAAESFGYDLGVVYYTYVSASDFNYPEIYAGISKGWFAAKVWYSWDFGGLSESAYYVEGNGTFPIGESGFAFVAHAGYSGGDYWDTFYGDGYFDWSAGVTKSFGNFAVALKFIDGSDLPGPGPV